jgi:prepilin-type N-terminal cleavage/methylation domain-containing protein
LRRFSSATDCCASRSPNRPRPARRADGFSLLEVIVALAILGIGLGVVFQGLGQGLRLRGESADNVRISLVAERLLGALAERDAAPTAVEEGEESGCRWRLEPQEPAAGADSASSTAAATRRGAPLVPVRLVVATTSGRTWEATLLLPRDKVAVR